ncbi:MAG: 3-hydroxyacyl-CoA dehydrogenase family protein, partial [Acidimicrobiales bacterium]
MCGSESLSVAGVVGGGTMGTGIAHVLLVAGIGVRVLEVDADRADAAYRAIAGSLRRAAERGRVQEPEKLLGGLEVGHSSGLLSGCDPVIEAAPEELCLKQEILARIEQVTAESALIASNTSSLSIGALATALRVPGRFLGLHFFNPVPASELIEIVEAATTETTTVARARGWAEVLGKESIVVKDSPGFATSRLGLIAGIEAIRMVEEGVASVGDIDRAMVLGYRHPMGPLRLTDLVGLDVRLDIARYLSTTLGERFRPPDLLVEKVAAG